jgi:hypothetical protein
VVLRRAVEHASVVPNSHVVWTIPTEPDLQIVVLYYKLQNLVEDMLALYFGDTIHTTAVEATGK